MTPQRFEQVQDLFLRARQLAPDRRDSFLRASSCFGDQELLADVKSLLDADDDSSAGLTLNAPVLGGRLDLTALLDTEPAAPSKVDRYHLLEAIGEGGMGTVYKAEQHWPVKRMVALKLIKLGMDTKQVIARFEAERQALAMMDHPNIAKALDAGATDTGRPYFVMDLVCGIPITEYCDQNHLDIEHRLGLFTQVCNAIQHAHQKGIIHRDIKPTNVLVTLNDGEAVPKVIDFGVAKATQGTLTDKTLDTHFHQLVGTPAYMSPEQAEIGRTNVDTRSDIYSLGVLLYELLAGMTPFAAKELMANGVDEMRRTIREVEPIRPSFRLINATDKTSADRVRGDLDWIVMKCLEKDPARRYQTASDLVSDIRRFLTFEPIVARPPSAIYRMKKGIRRNRMAVLSAVAVFVVLIAGIVGSTWQAIRAARAQVEAVDARVISENRAEELRRTLYFAQMYEAGQAATVSGGLARVRDLLAPWKESTPDLRGWEWHYLDSLCHTALVILRGHQGPVLSVAWSPYGKQLASGGHDGGIRIWDASSARELLVVDAAIGKVNAVAWSRDGRRLAAAGGSGTVKVLEPSSGHQLLSIAAHQGSANAVAWNLTGTLLASAGEDRVVCVWDTKSGQRVRILRGHANEMTAVGWSPDGTRLASSANGTQSAPETTKIWDVTSGKELHSFVDGVKCVAWSPDSARLATSGEDWMVRVLDASKGERLFSQSHIGTASSVSWNPAGDQIASGGASDWLIKFWDVNANRLVHTLEGHQGRINCVAWNPTGTTVASASDDGTVKIWDSPTTSKRRVQPVVLSGHAERYNGQTGGWNWVESVAWRPDGALLASAGRDRLVKLWDPTTGRELFTLAGHDNWVINVAWSPDGKYLASAGSDEQLKIWDINARKEIRTFPGHTFVAWSPDGRRIASNGKSDLRSNSEDDALKIWNVGAGIEQITLAKSLGEIGLGSGLDWSPDGRQLAVAALGDTLRIYDTITGEVVQTLRGHSGRIGSVKWSPDGKRLASSAGDHRVKIWSATDGREIFTLQAHTQSVGEVAWSPDGTRLASAGRDQTVRIWDTVSGRLVMTFTYGPAQTMASVRWSPDGRRLAAGGRGGCLFVYDSAGN